METLGVHDRSPGIAASVILKVLMDELVGKGVLNAADVAGILGKADSTLADMGVSNSAIEDARYASGEGHGVGPSRPSPPAQAASAARFCGRQFQGNRSAIRLAG